jgi:hypothetical protein
MILRVLCIWLVFYSLLSSLMHGTVNLKFNVHLVGILFKHKATSAREWGGSQVNSHVGSFQFSETSHSIKSY